MTTAARLRYDFRTAELRWERNRREWLGKRQTIYEALGRPARYEYYKSEVARYQRLEWMADDELLRAVYHAAGQRAEKKGKKELEAWRARTVPLALALAIVEE